MNPRIEEERLTAYLLGEVSEDERREIERALEQSAEVRDELAGLKAFVERLEQGLQAEAG